jgi:hypothetical protein
MIKELEKIMENYKTGYYNNHSQGETLLELDLQDIQRLIDAYKIAIKNAYNNGYEDAEEVHKIQTKMEEARA